MAKHYPIKAREHPMVKAIPSRASVSQPGSLKFGQFRLSDKLRTEGVPLADDAPPSFLNPPRNPSMVSSYDGAIKKLLFSIPNACIERVEDTENPFLALYKRVFATLTESIELVVVTHVSAVSMVETILRDAGLLVRTKLIIVPDRFNFTLWAEDPYLVNIDKDQNVWLVEPSELVRGADRYLADIVVESGTPGLKRRASPLFFRGGNTLVGDKFILIGGDTLDACWASVFDPEAGPRQPSDIFDHTKDIRKFIDNQFKQQLDWDRPFIAVGSNRQIQGEILCEEFDNDGESWTQTLYSGNSKGTTQPIFHIDMFVSLVGPDPDSKKKFHLFVGDPRLAADILCMDLPDHALASVFDDIAENLKNSGFRVTRNPLPLTYADDPKSRHRLWYYATSNNVMMQSTPTSKIVWMPTYGHGIWNELAKTDAANTKLWNEAGYEVRPLGDFHPVAENLGAMHCIKKYLARG